MLWCGVAFFMELKTLLLLGLCWIVSFQTCMVSWWNLLMTLSVCLFPTTLLWVTLALILTWLSLIFCVFLSSYLLLSNFSYLNILFWIMFNVDAYSCFWSMGEFRFCIASTVFGPVFFCLVSSFFFLKTQNSEFLKFLIYYQAFLITSTTSMIRVWFRICLLILSLFLRNICFR